MKRTVWLQRMEPCADGGSLKMEERRTARQHRRSLEPYSSQEVGVPKLLVTTLSFCTSLKSKDPVSTSYWDRLGHAESPHDAEHSSHHNHRPLGDLVAWAVSLHLAPCVLSCL